MKGSLVGGSVAEKADGDTAVPAHLAGQAASDGKRDSAAHDADRSQHPDLEIDDVHLAALALAIPSGFTGKFGHRAS